MASVVVKTIWQSKEIHEAGDPPAGVESRAQLVPEAPGGVTSPAKGITKKKKAVSFHGWVSCTLLMISLVPSKAWMLRAKRDEEEDITEAVGEEGSGLRGESGKVMEGSEHGAGAGLKGSREMVDEEIKEAGGQWHQTVQVLCC